MCQNDGYQRKASNSRETLRTGARTHQAIEVRASLRALLVQLQQLLLACVKLAFNVLPLYLYIPAMRRMCVRADNMRN